MKIEGDDFHDERGVAIRTMTAEGIVSNTPEGMLREIVDALPMKFGDPLHDPKLPMPKLLCSRIVVQSAGRNRATVRIEYEPEPIS